MLNVHMFTEQQRVAHSEANSMIMWAKKEDERKKKTD